MLLNLYVIRNDFPELSLKGTLRDSPSIAKLEYPLLCGQVIPNFQEQILYILNTQYLKDPPSCCVSASLICIGKPPQIWCERCMNLLYTEEDISAPELMNLINARFYYYQRWEHSLQEIVDQRLPLSEFGRRCEDLIHNPISAQGRNFSALFIHLPQVEAENEKYQAYQEQYAYMISGSFNGLSNEHVQDLISDPDFQASAESEKPYIYPGKPYGFRSLTYCIFLEKTLIARVFVEEVLTPIQDKDFVLIQLLGEYICKALQCEAVYGLNRPKDMEEVLSNLISHKLLPESKIQAALDACQWKEHDNYLCIVLENRLATSQESVLSTIALNLSLMLQETYYTIREDSVVLCCNLSRLRQSRVQLIDILIPTLKSTVLVSGFSTDFWSFKNLYYYYKQAKFAIETGNCLHPDKECYHFEEYQSTFFINRCLQGNIPEALLPNGLQALIAYDNRKGTNYVQLLRLYLEKERNIAETIRAAYLHRNTFLYQIAKIEKIIQLDLNNPDNRLILEIAFRILDQIQTGE